MQPLSSSLLLLSWLLLSLVEQTSCLPGTNQKCYESSCGNLQIKYPFYLKSDASACNTTGPEYELNCEGNRTILQIFQPEKYIVTEIGLYHINVVTERFVQGSCTVPTVSPTPSMLKGTYDAFSWGSLVKCGESISNNSMYMPVSCMSTNNSFVYLVVDAYQVKFLQRSCSYLAMFPISYNITGSAFELLQKGFPLLYSWQSTTTGTFTLPWIENIEYYALQLGVLLLLYRMLFMRIFLMPPTILVFLAYIVLKSKTSTDNVERFLQNLQSLMPTRYAYTDIIRITGNFRQKLGQGGFGCVFKGVLPGGILVAVKVLGNSSCNGDDFINEVSSLGRIHHFNVVRLVGFCSEGSKRALIYEYMLNGSLDKCIFTASSNKSGHHTFTVAKLNEITLGIARGIEYLHRGCNMQILHFDIKPNNILLDVNFTPKISDFGLAKLYPKEHSLVSISAARGTIGYMAPELISRSFGAISDKSDVYSFGMLLMEMVSGRRNADRNMDRQSQVYYPSWIYNKLIKDQHDDISENLDLSEVEKKLCLVALWCIQIKSSDRPDMSRVIEMLESDLDSLRMPPRPFFASDSSTDVTQFETAHSSHQLPVISEFSSEEYTPSYL
ncbi:rust resistance kinase Lr10-like [Carex rostrata]